MPLIILYFLSLNGSPKLYKLQGPLNLDCPNSYYVPSIALILILQSISLNKKSCAIGIISESASASAAEVVFVYPQSLRLAISFPSNSLVQLTA